MTQLCSCLEAGLPRCSAAELSNALWALGLLGEVDRCGGELEAEMRREEANLAQLRAQTAGLEAKAAAVQAKIDSAGECD